LQEKQTDALVFTKLHGLGNDFVLLDFLPGSVRPAHSKLGPLQLSRELIRKIGDRRFGVGFDQLLVLRSPAPDPTLGDERAQTVMDIYNPDASVAEMCGNGVRAAGLYLSRYHPERALRVQTLGGLKELQRDPQDPGVFTVQMGEPRFNAGSQGVETIDLGGPLEKVSFRAIDMGNPHAVSFQREVFTFPLEQVGPLVERHPRFPNRTNFEVIEKIGDHELRVRVWERGAGITLACGTGACASVVAAIAEHSEWTGKWIGVQLPGGRLEIRWAGPGTPVEMRGPATEVFLGRFLLS
jgi:diaminopimelate epimerase